MVSDIHCDGANGSGDLPVPVTGSEISPRVSRRLDISTPHAIHGEFLFLIPPLPPHLRHARFTTQETHVY